MSDAPKPPMLSGGKVMPVIPQSMEDAFRLANAIHKAGMAPRGLNTPEQIMVVIMRGLEVGMTPFQALDKIALVNGRPTIWGDGAVALVRASGLCEYIKEWVEGSGDSVTAYCETLRRGEKSSVVRFFSVSDAKRAGLWGKTGTWTQYPYRMLAMRAKGFCLRDVYADVLGGMYLKEETEEFHPHQSKELLHGIMPPDPSRKALPAEVEEYINKDKLPDISHWQKSQTGGAAASSPSQGALGKAKSALPYESSATWPAELPENASDEDSGGHDPDAPPESVD